MSVFFERRQTVKQVLTWYAFIAVLSAAMCLYLGYQFGAQFTYLSANCVGFHVK